MLPWPGVWGCPAAAAQEHLSTEADTIPAAGLDDPAAFCFARGGAEGLANLSLGMGARL